ncbi:MAG: ABC transporter permease, partial [Nocardioidaceae bacterium]
MTGYAGTGELLRLAVRRDRVVLPAWLLGLSGVTFYAGRAMGTAFPTQASLDAYAASAAHSPALVAMSGPPLALDTLPGVVLTKVWMMSLLGVSLMALLEAVRHTRSEEEAGRAELLRGTVVGRQAPVAVALLLGCGASVVLGALTARARAGAAVPAVSALLYGASTAVLGVVFAAVGVCLAQLFAHARAAQGAGLALVGLAYVVRALGDVRGDWLVWLSPMGWAQATHILGDERWWPLGVGLLAAVALSALARRLSAARDLDAGLVAAREGAPAAGPLLSGALGLAVRLERGALAGWAVGMFALTLMIGSLSGSVQDMARDNPALESYLRRTGQGTFVESFLATMLLVVALLAAGYATSAAARLRTEESSGRLEPLLATGLSRGGWLSAWLTVAVAGTVGLLFLGGLGLGLAAGEGVGPWRLAA